MDGGTVTKDGNDIISKTFLGIRHVITFHNFDSPFLLIFLFKYILFQQHGHYKVTLFSIVTILHTVHNLLISYTT